MVFLVRVDRDDLLLANGHVVVDLGGGPRGSTGPGQCPLHHLDGDEACNFVLEGRAVDPTLEQDDLN